MDQVQSLQTLASSGRPKAEIIQNSRAQPQKNLEPAAAQPRYHILVVEDNLIKQRVLCNQLKKIGCTIQVADHGREALDELRKTNYCRKTTISPSHDLSVVLMDVEMPIMDRNECAKEIRTLQKSGDIVGHVPIIAVSAIAPREQIEQAKRVGMGDAISKPFRITELMTVIKTLLERGSNSSHAG